MKDAEMVTVSRIKVAGVSFAIAIPASALIKTAKRAVTQGGWHTVVAPIAVRELAAEVPSAILAAGGGRRKGKC